MTIYVVHADALDDGKQFHSMTDSEIEELYVKDDFNVCRYESLKELCDDWNNDTMFDSSCSYIRVINN